ncbi:MAG: nodulation protein NfeD, partial [Candidatus Eremiobacteraeota bacterium]|nr:nodulation protein NfeD [Candidatus Eremiobacteraeota bacterium]
ARQRLAVGSWFAAIVAIALLALGGQAWAAKSAAAPTGVVYDLHLDGIVGPATARHIVRGLRAAERAGAQAFLIEMDTPGGLMQSMAEISKAMLNSPIPTLVYVYPSGARAASAGVFITYAANIAAMATTTHLGAAHPVAMGASGGAPDKTEMTKITNDAVAMIRGFAERRGRNANWAVQAVRQSVSITDQEALKLHVINLIADSPRDLLAQVDGWTVKTDAGPLRLRTRDARLIDFPMDSAEQLLLLLADPNVGLILMTVAMYGIVFELSNPGAVFPGVIGIIALILAFASFAVVSVNIAGLLFLAFAVVLFIADIKVPSHGVLTAGGLGSFVLGSILLTEYQAPYLRISISVVVILALITTGFFVFVIGAGVRAQRRKVVTGREGLIGAVGVARSDLAPSGTVFLGGELWRAQSEATSIPAGHRVRVIAVKGLNLTVQPTEPTAKETPA